MSSKASKSPSPMTTQAAARIQSSTAKASGGGVTAGSFATRAQRAATANQARAKGVK
ncbi:hypothetical protein CJO88_05830 [Ralstonia solanacearum]|nr:hypothetical protein CJO88_05830 [Ralstonia solanacearum]